MSEFAFYLVPSDPFCLPDQNQREQFLDLFKEVCPLPNANGDYYCHVYDEPQPVDAGQGFEAIVCPGCGCKLALFDQNGYTPHQEWWQAALSGPRDAFVTIPCCGSVARLVDLRFHDLGAFARFAVGALEPSFSDYWKEGGDSFGCLTHDALRRFEEIVGCPVLQIWAVP